MDCASVWVGPAAAWRQPGQWDGRTVRALRYHRVIAFDTLPGISPGIG